MTEQDKNNIDEILNFWFVETSFKQKYAKDKAFDDLIRDKYLSTYNSIAEGKLEAWKESAEGKLALIIVLDQFSRNMFRDDAKSFALDNLALEIAESMVASGEDKEIDLERRTSVYMPYMHSESKEVHERALKIFEAFTEEGGDPVGLKYEKKHKAIIDEFGRYPHRNEVLGRESTPEEVKFNDKHGGF